MDTPPHEEHIHHHGRPPYLKVVAAAVGAMIFFSGLVSGGIYHWASDAVGVASLALFVLCLPGQTPARLGGMWPVAALLAVTASSALWSVNLNNTYRDVFTLAGYTAFAYLAALAVAGDNDTRRRLLWTLFAASVVVSVYGIYQYFIGFAHTEQYLRQSGAASGLSGGEIERALYKLGGRRAFSTLLSPDVLACYLGMAFPVGLSLMYSARRKAAYIPALAAVLAAAVLTKSVGGLIAFFAGTLVFVAATWPARGWTLSRALALGLVVAVAAGSVYGVAVRRGRAEAGLENSISQRYNYWSGALGVFKGSQYAGRGAGSFEILYPEHMRPGADETRFAHSLLLQTLAETGLVGLASVCLVFLVFFLNCSRKMAEPSGAVLMAGVMAGGAVFFVHNLVDYSYYVHETAVVFWFLFGLSASGSGEAGPAPAQGRIFQKVLIRLLLAAAAITIGFFYIKSCFAGFREAESLRALEAAGITNAAAARTTPVPDIAVKLAGEAIRLKPYDDRYRAFLAGLYEGRAVRYGPESAMKAEELYKDAIRLNPHYPFYYRDLGLLYLRLGDGPKAKENFRKALARYPASENLKKYLELTGN
jgi:O-antigen ligase